METDCVTPVGAPAWARESPLEPKPEPQRRDTKCAWILGLFLLTLPITSAAQLTIHTNFPGGAMELRKLDQANQSITFAPANFKNRGWACWWHFKLTGVDIDKPVVLNLESRSSFGRPVRAMFSHDGKTWQHTEPGAAKGTNVRYSHKSTSDTIHFAWGPPFQLSDAHELTSRVADADVGAEKFELCRSNEGRSVPALRWNPKTAGKRPGIWIEARQHAWESGSSWVCRGLLEWLASDEHDAKTLRDRARIVVVPIMDLDNVERGAGGKGQIPHDHNRDWSDKPVYAEVAAAQKMIRKMDADGEFDLFLDLHNPAPRDSVPFFFGSPKTHLNPLREQNQKRFHQECLETLGKEPFGFSKTIRVSGPGYHPLWRAISKNWVAENTAKRAVDLTLETSWNTFQSTPKGYMDYGRALGRAIYQYLGSRNDGAQVDPLFPSVSPRDQDDVGQVRRAY